MKHNKKPKTSHHDADAELERCKDQVLRTAAELQNFRRRAQEEKQDFARFAKAEFMLELLPVVDNFRRASGHIPEELRENDWTRGIVAIEGQFENVLKNLGLEPIPTTGEQFNPHLHQAIEEVPGEKNIIIKEVQKGYTMGGKILRPAHVKVGNGIAADEKTLDTPD